MKTNSRLLPVLAIAAALFGFSFSAGAQCTELLSGLRLPQASAWTNQRNLLISEAGNGMLHSGRISIVAPDGTRRTLIDGLPSAPADVGDPSGPAGMVMRGRTLYLAIGVGNVAIRTPGLPPRTALENPMGPASPLFSSVLEIHFSAAVEKNTEGVTLTTAHQNALAAGETVTLGGRGQKLTMRMIANFQNFVPAPFPGFGPFPPVPNNIRVSNPFGLLAEGSSLYVTDGGMNQVWRVDLVSGAVAVHTTFPNIPNPLFGMIGYPDVEAVPTGIASDAGQLLVSLFTGFPFAPGASSIQAVDPVTGAATPFITGRKNAIGVLPVRTRGETSYLVLQHASAGPFFASPGVVLRFDDPSAPPVLVTDCLTRPVTMALDEKTNDLYVAEAGGRLVRLPLAP